MLRVLSAFLGYLVSAEVIASNPASNLGQFTTRHRERYVTAEESVRLFRVLDERREQWPHWVAIIELAIFTSMRKSEILQLRWDNVEEAEPNPKLALAIHKTRAKTGVKYVPLSLEALEVIEKAKTWRRQGNDYVFPSVAANSFYPKSDSPNKHASAGGLQRAWEIIRQEAGLIIEGEKERFVFHSQRHSYASVAITNGVPIAAIGSAMGHTNSAATSRYAKIGITAAAGSSNAVGTIFAALRAKAREG